MIARVISYVADYHVFLCVVCGVGVRRSQLGSHLRIQHRFTSVQLKALDPFLHTILSDPSVHLNETAPSYVESAILGLPIFTDGLLCQFNRMKCQYVCRSADSMRKHCQRVHQWRFKSGRGRPSAAVRITLSSPPWIAVSCQRLFLFGPNSHYFEVRTIEQSLQAPSSDVWQQMETAVEQARQDLIDKIQIVDNDSSPWLHRTRWAEVLSIYTRPQLLAYIQEPDSTENSDANRLWITVRRLLEHCQRTTMKSGDFIRTQMVQSERTSRALPPLQSYLDRATLLKNVRHWQLILLFFLRSQEDTEAKTLPYELTSSQHRAFHRLGDGLRTARTIDIEEEAESSDDLDTLELLCLDFCFSLLHHQVRTDEYESALIVALAVLGLTDVGFRTPQDYPSMLSGIMKTARFMMIQIIVRPTEFAKEFFHDLGTEDQPEQGAISRTEQLVHQFMIRGTQSPMQWIMNLRAYGMKIAYNTTSEGRLSWIGDQIVYKDIEFTMVEYRTFVHGLVHEVERLLLDELLFARTVTESIPTVNITQLKDNVLDDRTGFSFLQDVRNSTLIDGAKWIRNRIESHPLLRTQFLPVTADLHLPSPAILTYLHHVRSFLTKLLLLMHITGGQPARITELLTVQHRNTVHDVPRNIFIEHGLVSFVTRYHKGFSVSAEFKIIHRFLPSEVGLLLVRYLWLVLPFVERLEAFYQSSYKLSTFL